MGSYLDPKTPQGPPLHHELAELLHEADAAYKKRDKDAGIAVIQRIFDVLEDEPPPRPTRPK